MSNKMKKEYNKKLTLRKTESKQSIHISKMNVQIGRERAVSADIVIFNLNSAPHTHIADMSGHSHSMIMKDSDSVIDMFH